MGREAHWSPWLRRDDDGAQFARRRFAPHQNTKSGKKKRAAVEMALPHPSLDLTSINPGAGEGK
jgi:hypothetical protein